MTRFFVPEFRNPARNHKGTIDCEINHPRHGWIPFTCDPDDTSPPIDSVALTAAIEAAGGIAEYEAPDRSNVYRPLPNDIFHAMRDTLGITDAQVEAAINATTEEGIERNLALRRFHSANTYRRDSALLASLATALSISDDTINAAWRQAEALL